MGISLSIPIYARTKCYICKTVPRPLYYLGTNFHYSFSDVKELNNIYRLGQKRFCHNFYLKFSPSHFKSINEFSYIPYHDKVTGKPNNKFPLSKSKLFEMFNSKYHGVICFECDCGKISKFMRGNLDDIRPEIGNRKSNQKIKY